MARTTEMMRENELRIGAPLDEQEIAAATMREPPNTTIAQQTDSHANHPPSSVTGSPMVLEPKSSASHWTFWIAIRGTFALANPRVENLL